MRERWNEVIRCCLKAVDNHNELYFSTLDPWHLQKAQELRSYVDELKTRIVKEELHSSTTFPDQPSTQRKACP